MGFFVKLGKLYGTEEDTVKTDADSTSYNRFVVGFRLSRHFFQFKTRVIFESHCSRKVAHLCVTQRSAVPLSRANRAQLMTSQSPPAGFEFFKPYHPKAADRCEIGSIQITF